MHQDQPSRFTRIDRVKDRRSRVALIILSLCMSGIAASSVSADQPLNAAVTASLNSQKESEAESPWGISVIGVRRTAANYMLEFRYRVEDSEKAAHIMNRKIKPELVIEKTGRKLQVPISPKIGPLRQSPKFAKSDHDYFMFFANPGRIVKAGDKVTVVIGDFNAKSIVVE